MKKSQKKYNGYKLYTKDEMSKIAKEEGFVFVETSRGDNYEIKKSDIVDFIVLESARCLDSVDINMYVPNPNIEEPFLSTFGSFLNKINQVYRNEIIDRLIKLQTGLEKPKDVKVFDNNVFYNMSLIDLGEQEGKTIQFDKFFKKYYENTQDESQDNEFEYE